MNITFIFKSNGNYIGFISNNNIFSRDGEYLGWVENSIVWGKDGRFKGELKQINNHYYVLRNSLTIPPMARVPKVSPVTPVQPPSPANTLPVMVPIGFVDGF